MNTKILVVSHKPYQMPVDDIHLPIQVGFAENIPGFIRDNTGDNISNQNQYFCELTALYWAWKNLDADIIGLEHYRRRFVNIPNNLDKNTIYVPKKRHYYIETIYSHYSHTFTNIHLDKTREIIKDKYPDYLNSFDKVMKQKSAYMFNMMILSKELLNDYCTWLFNVLFELKDQIDISNYTDFEKRYLGRISERLFNVWLDKQPNKVKELNYKYLEKINWSKKIASFLKAKFFKKGYEKSF